MTTPEQQEPWYGDFFERYNASLAERKRRGKPPTFPKQPKQQKKKQQKTRSEFNPSKAVLYRMYDVEGVLLYVGASINVGSRISSHQNNKPWFKDVANISIQQGKFATYLELYQAETDAIKSELPKYNICEHMNNIGPDGSSTI